MPRGEPVTGGSCHGSNFFLGRHLSCVAMALCSQRCVSLTEEGNEVGWAFVCLPRAARTDLPGVGMPGSLCLHLPRGFCWILCIKKKSKASLFI